MRKSYGKLCFSKKESLELLYVKDYEWDHKGCSRLCKQR